MDISLKSEQFRQNLFKMIDESQLPPIIVYYITKQAAQLTERSYRMYLNNAAAQSSEEQQLDKENKEPPAAQE